MYKRGSQAIWAYAPNTSWLGKRFVFCVALRKEMDCMWRNIWTDTDQNIKGGAEQLNYGTLALERFSQIALIENFGK